MFGLLWLWQWLGEKEFRTIGRTFDGLGFEMPYNEVPPNSFFAVIMYLKYWFSFPIHYGVQFFLFASMAVLFSIGSKFKEHAESTHSNGRVASISSSVLAFAVAIPILLWFGVRAVAARSITLESVTAEFNPKTRREALNRLLNTDLSGLSAHYADADIKAGLSQDFAKRHGDFAAGCLKREVAAILTTNSDLELSYSKEWEASVGTEAADKCSREFDAAISSEAEAAIKRVRNGK